MRERAILGHKSYMAMNNCGFAVTRLILYINPDLEIAREGKSLPTLRFLNSFIENLYYKPLNALADAKKEVLVN